MNRYLYCLQDMDLEGDVMGPRNPKDPDSPRDKIVRWWQLAIIAPSVDDPDIEAALAQGYTVTSVRQLSKDWDLKDPPTQWHSMGSDDEFLRYLERNEYFSIRKLADGSWAALHRLAFTIGLHTALTTDSWSRRFCYTNLTDAEAAIRDLKAWDSEPEPVYVARRPKIEDL